MKHVTLFIIYFLIALSAYYLYDAVTTSIECYDGFGYDNLGYFHYMIPSLITTSATILGYVVAKLK